MTTMTADGLSLPFNIHQMHELGLQYMQCCDVKLRELVWLV